MDNLVYPNSCVFENDYSVSSCVTSEHVALPIENKSHEIRNRLFVKGFPEGTTAKELKDFFGQYGKVIDCNIPDVRGSSKQRSYGFVTFHQQNGSVTVRKLVWDFRYGNVEFKFKNCDLLIDHAFFKQKKKGLTTPRLIGSSDVYSGSCNPVPGDVPPNKPVINQLYMYDGVEFVPVYPRTNLFAAPY